MNAKSESYDAIAIGGGPAGACLGAILAEYGHRVLILEREKFPRYHIGESLIPFTFQPLERIGMIPKMKASHFVRKHSVTFVQPDGRRSQPFYFFNRYDRDTVAQTWQVLRSEFDQMLLDNAREKGAEVREETSVDRLLTEGDRVVGIEATHRPSGRTYEVRAPITVDCSGKEAFASNRRGWRMRDPYLNKIAVWTYPNFSFREVIGAHPEAAGLITDCLSGDVNKDFSCLWTWIREFVPLPDDLPYGEPLVSALTGTPGRMALQVETLDE